MRRLDLGAVDHAEAVGGLDEAAGMDVAWLGHAVHLGASLPVPVVPKLFYDSAGARLTLNDRQRAEAT